MKTTLSYLPYDIIWSVGNFLDYDTVQTLNRVLEFEDRLVEKIPKREIIEHELYLWIRRIEYDMKEISVKWGPVLFQVEVCKLLNVLDKLKRKSRGYIVLEYSKEIRQTIKEMCIEILESPQDNYTQRVPPHIYKILKDSAAELLYDIEDVKHIESDLIMPEKDKVLLKTNSMLAWLLNTR